MSDSIRTIDTHYFDMPRGTAAYLMREGEGDDARAAFVETNTTHAVPRLLEALAEEGLTPQQVQYVIITHIHLDHAGGAAALLERCPNATLLAHPRAAKHAVDPSKLVKSAKQVYGEDAFAKLYGEIAPVPEARVRIMGDGEELAFGARTLRFFHTRGHANHHMCIHDSKSNAVFTGDSFGLVYPDMQTGGRFAIPSTSPTDFDAEAALASLDAIVGTGCETVYLTHFGGFQDIEAIAGQLREQLEESGRIVEDADANVADEELDAYCMERVHEMMQRRLATVGLENDEKVVNQLKLDSDLNGQGLAFAVKKRRFKRSRA